MLSRAFEWYRVVNVSPTSDTIESRQAAARDIVKAIDDADDWDLAFDCAAGAVVGFDVAFAQSSPVVTSLVNAMLYLVIGAVRLTLASLRTIATPHD